MACTFGVMIDGERNKLKKIQIFDQNVVSFSRLLRPEGAAAMCAEIHFEIILCE
jgi:hypothetical protein